MPSKKRTSLTVRESATGFAVVGANGETLRDGFKTPQLGWMWAGRQGLHKGRDAKQKRGPTEFRSISPMSGFCR
jgi:hypothetical protein